MKRLNSILLITITIVISASCQGNSKQKVMRQHSKKENYKKEQISQNKETDARIFLIPLSNVYSKQTIENIMEDDYKGSAFNLIMDFVVEDNSIVYSNNDKKRIEKYNLFNGITSDIRKFPSSDEQKTDYSITRIYKFGKREFMMSSLDFHIWYDLESDKYKFFTGGFSKNSIKNTRVLHCNRLAGVTDFELNNSIDYLTLETGWDSCKDSITNGLRCIFAVDDSISLYTGRSDSFINLNFYLSKINNISEFEDVDIVYSNSDKIGFVLKSPYPSENGDIFVLFDLHKKEVINYENIISGLDKETHFGDPAIFSTGKVYKLFQNKLWSVRTTNRGVCFEYWSLNI